MNKKLLVLSVVAFTLIGTVLAQVREESDGAVFTKPMSEEREIERYNQVFGGRPKGVRGTGWNSVSVTVTNDTVTIVTVVGRVKPISSDFANQIFLWVDGEPMGYDYGRKTNQWVVKFRAAKLGTYPILAICQNENAVAEGCSIRALSVRREPQDPVENRPIVVTKWGNDKSDTTTNQTSPPGPPSGQPVYRWCNKVGLEACGKNCTRPGWTMKEINECSKGCYPSNCKE